MGCKVRGEATSGEGSNLRQREREREKEKEALYIMSVEEKDFMIQFS